jgi:hypothetical protein
VNNSSLYLLFCLHDEHEPIYICGADKCCDVLLGWVCLSATFDAWDEAWWSNAKLYDADGSARTATTASCW